MITIQFSLQKSLFSFSKKNFLHFQTLNLCHIRAKYITKYMPYLKISRYMDKFKDLQQYHDAMYLQKLGCS